MNCPECGNRDVLRFRRSFRLRERVGIAAAVAQLFGLGPIEAVRSGEVVLCARCATQFLATAGSVERVIPKRIEDQIKSQITRDQSRTDELRDRSGRQPWTRD